MDSSEEGSDLEGPPLMSNRQQSVKSSKKPAAGSDVFMMENSLLKPKLDTIFAEVEKSLPSIDFDLSDVSSDNEEPVILHRHLKKTDYDYDDDKDLDTSLSGESLSDLLPPYSDNLSLKSFTNDDINTPKDPSVDNDMAFYMQQRNKTVTTKSTGTSWTDVVIEAEGDKPLPRFQNWIDPKEKTEDSTIHTGVDLENESISQTSLSDNEEKHEIESTSEKPKKISSSATDVEVDSGDKRLDKLIKKEELRIREREIVDNVISSRAPRLITPGLESLDLDTLLNTINEDNQYAPPTISNTAWPAQRNIESLFAAGEGNNRIESVPQNTNETLLERLARLSMRQSGEDLMDIDPVTGAPKVTDAEDKDLQTMNMTNMAKTANITTTSQSAAYKSAEQVNQSIKKNTSGTVTSSCGTNTTDLMEPRIITPSKYKTKPDVKPATEPDTVFIDLRNFEKNKQEQQEKIERVQRILNIQPESSSDDSSDSDNDSGLWFEQRQRMKRNMAAKGVSTPALPDKPKPNRPSVVKHPQRVIPMNHRRKQNNSEDSNRQSESRSDIENEQEEIARRQAEQEEREKQKKMEEARKLRELREAERQSRLRLSKNLEAVRPTASVSSKQDAAENTPVIFDYDASYEPAPHTLPSILATEQECLLLTIHLSSNGEIILHRGKTNKSVDTGVGLSASYTVLLTWLLSLVPENFSFLQGKTETEDKSAMFVPPFYVLGLQQMWLDEHLCLVVAVTPVEQFDARYVPVKSKKAKVKDEIKDSSPFQQHVSKYLSVNTLHSVCPWLQDMVSVEVTSPRKDGTNCPTYIYRPPLPNITTKPLSTFVQVNHDPQAARKVFNSSVGFFYQTIDSEEIFCDQIFNDSCVKYDTQNTMSLVYKKIFCEPRSMMGIFNRILQEGLDLSGVRLLYPTQQLLSLASGQTFPENISAQGDVNVLNNIGPVLAIALRGTFARTIWLDAVGPSDPALARRTDPNSLCALFGGVSRDECLLFCPRNVSRVHTELTRWFGGRVPPGGVIDVGTPYTRKDHLRSGSPKRGKGKRASHDSRDEKTVVPPHRPPAALTATTKNDIFLVLSPLVPPQSMGIVLSTCQRRGYQIRGIRRSRLTTKKSNSLGIDGSVIGAFCPGTTGFDMESSSYNETTDQHVKHVEAMAPSTFLQLQKENATHSAASLIEAFMIQLTMQGIMNSIQSNVGYDLTSRHLFHAARYSDSLLATLGGDFSKCIDYDIEVNPSGYIVPTLYTNPELEEIVVLLLLGHEVLKTCGLFVGKLLNLVPYSKNPVVTTVKDGFELLGIKWLPSLSMSQAKEVTPFEVGDRLWKENIHTLTSEPAVVLVLRSIGAFKKLESAIPKPDKKSTRMDFLMSKTAEEAYSFARSFFTDRELFCDPQSRPLLPYLPQSRHLIGIQSSIPRFPSQINTLMKPELLKESIFEIMLSGPHPLTTFMLVKPRAVKRHLSKILKKIVQESFHIVGFRLEVLDKETIINLLQEDDMDEDQIHRHLDHISSGPCLLLCLQRENAVKKLLDLLGPKDPVAARRQSQFLWRGVFGADNILNAFHGSSNYVRGISEQNKFFPDGLCCQPTEDLKTENITSPAVDSIIDIKYQDHRSIVIEENMSDQHNSIDSPRHLLLQTTCVVLKPLLSKCLIRGHLASIDIIEGLINNGFELVGSRMIWFNQEQAEHFLHLIDAGSFAQVSMLLSGPSIVLALQRDNAVISFDSQLGSNYGSESLIGKYGENIIRPVDIKQAHRMLLFFFDELMPGSQVQIVSKVQG